MHPHLHTEYNSGCEELMNAMAACHARGFLWKAMGMCSNTKKHLSQCLREERLRHQVENRGHTTDKNSRVRQLWKEIDENS